MLKEFVICDSIRDEGKKIQNIVEDSLSRPVCEKNVQFYDSGEALLKVCENGSLLPDVVFINVKLCDMSGIEVVKRINKLAPQCYVIYLSDSEMCCPEVYFTEHQFFVPKSMFEKYLSDVRKKIVTIESSRFLPLVIPLKRSGQVHIDKKKILYTERRKRTTVIHCEDGELETTLSTNEMELALCSKDFVRCHNSFIISMKNISVYTRERVTMSNGMIVPISRSYQKLVRDVYNQWKIENKVSIL